MVLPRTISPDQMYGLAIESDWFDKNQADAVPMRQYLRDMEQNCMKSDVNRNQPRFRKPVKTVDYFILVGENPVDNEGMSVGSTILFRYQSIISHAVVYYYESDTCELYSVCTVAWARNSGAASKLLDGIISQMRKEGKHLWLSLNFTNDLWYPILNLYTKMGFQNPEVTQQSPNGNQNTIWQLGLTFYHDRDIPSGTSLDHIRMQAEYFHLAAYKTMARVMKLEMYTDEMFELKRIADKKENEFSFHLFTESVFGDTITAVFYGHQEGGPESVPIDPNSDAIAFAHTHPAVGYKKFDAAVMWASMPDYNALLYHFHKAGSAFQVVATKEGFHLVSLSTTSQYLLGTFFHGGFIADISSRVYHCLASRFWFLRDWIIGMDVMEGGKCITKAYTWVQQYTLELLLHDLAYPDQTPPGGEYPFDQSLEKTLLEKKEAYRMGFGDELLREYAHRKPLITERDRKACDFYKWALVHEHLPPQEFNQRLISGNQLPLNVSKGHPMFQMRWLPWDQIQRNEQNGKIVIPNIAFLDLPKWKRETKEKIFGR